ncbi:S8 family serine peptidase [Thermoflexus sp.]|uniref:S8 family serine peptidase n=1 Tax=Thermoflexus sp. TaxID=1969742 RepID=UPI0035E3F598
MTKETDLNNVMRRVVYSKPLNGIRWAVGEIQDSQLRKLAGLPGVIAVISTESYQPVEAPPDDELPPTRGRLTGREIRELLQQGGKSLLFQKLRELRGRQPRPVPLPKPVLPPGEGRPSPAPAAQSPGAEPATVKVREIHGASEAHAKGYTGAGVVVAVVDTGVDFGHPDLQGTQARIPSGPYAGWPFAYNTLSGAFYALDPTATIGPDNYWDMVTLTWFAHTLPVSGATCTALTCTASLTLDYTNTPTSTLTFIWPNRSRSGQYYYTVHPDIWHLFAGNALGLGYAADPIAAPAVVIVADEASPGVYDTVYVDVDFDQDLTDEKPMRKGSELAGADLFDAAGNPGADGIWDLSAGMLTWIADGINPPPGVSALYDGVAVPQAGRLLSFVGDEDSHGTNCASDIAAQGVITDPEWIGPINPLFAGGESIGGVGGPVLAGMAPKAKVAAFQNGFYLPFDSWTLAALGFDGVPNSGDEAQIVSNSWGASATINDGWDMTSRFAHWLNNYFAPNTAFLVATGNGGHGYGTVTEPDGGSIIDVGASTSYGSLVYFEFVTPDQFTYGDVQPWSNRGPTTLGDVSPDVVAVGAWGTGANPLNIYFGNGQAAYDIFGGTSMATPVAAGNLALVYHAFRAKHGRWPTWTEARAIFLNAAHDLGYDVLTQGSGNVDADRATDIAAGMNYGYWVEPAQWTPGSYRGVEYPTFPAIMHAGQSAAKTFTIHNPTAVPFSVSLRDVTLEKVGELTFTLSFPSFGPPPFTRPTWVTDITPLIEAYDPDLVRAQVIFPYSVFDTNGNYKYDWHDRWRVLFYDWTDLNGDGNLWTDTNGNGRVDAGEIDIVGGIYEYNRFTYGYPSGTYLEASLGRDSLSRRHDGVFFGVQRRTTSSLDVNEGIADSTGTAGPDPVTMQVRITFYKKADWGWLSLSASSVSLPANGNATFQAILSVPSTARPGVYEGAIEVSHGPHKHVIPVVVHVAANGPTFDFGAASLAEPIGNQPYDNGHLFGGFDWTWRYESGDWKLFYYDIPNGTAGPGKAMIVDTRWFTTPTDVDTWIFARSTDFYSTLDPTFFGPQSVELVGGSNDTYIGSGRFIFDTATGGPREIVAGEIRDGLGFVALHNVLYAGAQFGEPLVGSAYQVQVTPYPVVITIPITSGMWTEFFSTTRSIPEGIQVLAFGLSQPQVLLNQTALQDDPDDPCTASWVYSQTISSGGLLEITTSSATPGLDIDLYLYLDDGDGTFECGTQDALVGSSTTPTAVERIRVTLPPDGRYWIAVHGWNVPGGSAPFNITIQAIQGTDLVVSGVPSGAIPAGTPVSFQVAFSKAVTPPATYYGILFVGPAPAPTALQVPVTIHFVPTVSRIYLPLVMKSGP